jgi:putative ABC transport system permease protein
MNIAESILLALDAVRAHKLRSILTLLSIAIGIFAIIGSGTAVTSLNNTMSGQLASLGENNFYVTKAPMIQTGDTWRKYRKRKPITYYQAKELQKKMTITDIVSIYNATGGLTMKAGNYSTDPDVMLIGANEHYLITSNTNIEFGNPMTSEDVNMNRFTAIIGNDVAVKLFPGTNPIGQIIRIKNQQFTVTGLTKPKGSMMGQSQDNMVIIPIGNFMRYYADEWEQSVNIIVRPPSKDALSPAMDETIGILRSIRNCKPWEENSFELQTNESLTQQFSSFTKYLDLFGLISGIIALLAAGVGIMNIMLVSVKERTREIGLRKAVGAKSNWILLQFVIEAITLCQLGGVIGIILGFIGGWVLSNAIDVTTSVPLLWVLLSVGSCTLLGVIFGGYPAWKAAKLDPIDALRYE